MTSARRASWSLAHRIPGAGDSIRIATPCRERRGAPHAPHRKVCPVCMHIHLV